MADQISQLVSVEQMSPGESTRASSWKIQGGATAERKLPLSDIPSPKAIWLSCRGTDPYNRTDLLILNLRLLQPQPGSNGSAYDPA